jgi:hypothetical protein
MRRELQNEKKELRGTILIFSVPLRKDFARKPAYWVEIYKSTHPTAKFTRYFVARQWSFVRSGETIQSESITRVILDLSSALDSAKSAIMAKLDAAWLLCEEQFDSSPPVVSPTKKEDTAIASCLTDWNLGLDKNLEKLNVLEENLPQSVKFKRAQQKRKAKAEW